MKEHWSETSMTETCHVRYLEGRLGKESGISSITLRTLVQQLKLKVRQIYHGQAFPSSPSTRAQHAGPCLLTRGIVRAAANARPVRAQVVYVPPESPACYHGQIGRAAASDGEQVANSWEREGGARAREEREGKGRRRALPRHRRGDAAWHQRR